MSQCLSQKDLIIMFGFRFFFYFNDILSVFAQKYSQDLSWVKNTILGVYFHKNYVSTLTYFRFVWYAKHIFFPFVLTAADVIFCPLSLSLC